MIVLKYKSLSVYNIDKSRVHSGSWITYMLTDTPNLAPGYSVIDGIILLAKWQFKLS